MDKFALILVSGIVGYLFANTKFLSERWWDKKYEAYIELLDIFHGLENSIVVLEWAAEAKIYIEDSELVSKSLNDFSNGIARLHSMQNKMLMLGMKEEQQKLMILLSALSFIQPFLFSKDSNEEPKEVHSLVKQTKGLCAGCGGEIALLGRKKLKEEVNIFTKVISYFKGS